MSNSAPAQEKKNEKIQLRVTEFQKNRIQALANRYAEGSMSGWIIEQSMRIPGAKRIGGRKRPTKSKR